MKYTFLICFIFSLSFAFGQDDNRIVIGEYAVIHSGQLNQDQYVMVHVPEGIDSTQKIPVLYVLDGSIHFYSAVGLINSYGGSTIPKMIVVGVINNNRFQDFSPDNYKNYSTYLTDELIPYIEDHYPSSNYRTLVGHSIAGLFTVNSLLNNSDVFNSYIAIDPSVSFGNSEVYLTEFIHKLKTNTLENNSFYTAIANTIPEGMTYSEMKTDTSTSTLHIRSILKLDESLSEIDGLYYNSEYFEDESHSTLPYIAMYKGLKSIFDFYEVPESVWDLNSSSSTILLNHFQTVSTRIGYKILPPESFVNSIAYYILGKGNLVEARKLFEMNISNYPESSNVYDSMGDYFITIEDEKNALNYYEKALTIMSTPELVKKIEELKK